MARVAITKRSVDAAKPAAKDYFLWDDEVAGFGLKVTPAGGKVFVYQYRIARPGEAERTPAKRYTIGKYGRLTPDQARKLAKALGALVEQGIDPRQRELNEFAAQDEADRRAEERIRLETDLAFATVADRWLDHYEHEKSRRPSSVRLAKLVVEKHLKPALKHKPLPHISRKDLQPIIDGVPTKQRATRRAVFAYASVLFGWAAKRGDIDSNPLAQMAKPEPPKARDRVLSDAELADVWTATAAISDPFGPFFRLLIATGQRRSEVAEMNWAELDRATKTWTIPGARAKNGIAHIVPLSDLAVANLDARAVAAQKADKEKVAEAWPKVGFVLTTTGTTPISGITKAKLALEAVIANVRGDAAQPMSGWRIHDLRRTVATGLQRLGVRFEVTEAVLNHVSGSKAGVAGIYQKHDWKEEKRSALDAWARHVETLLKPVAREKVVPIGAAKRSA